MLLLLSVHPAPLAWPPLPRQMLTAGKRLLLVSGFDYGAAMQPLIFSRGETLCGWNEPPLAAVNGVPDCHVGGDNPQVLGRICSCISGVQEMRHLA